MGISSYLNLVMLTHQSTRARREKLDGRSQRHAKSERRCARAKAASHGERDALNDSSMLCSVAGVPDTRCHTSDRVEFQTPTKCRLDEIFRQNAALAFGIQLISSWESKKSYTTDPGCHCSQGMIMAAPLNQQRTTKRIQHD